MLQQWFEFLHTQGAIFIDGQLTHFGDCQSELAALDTQDCITPLSHMGLLCVQGPDAQTFLQGQLTCNVQEITTAHSSLGAHCNLKGRMQSLFRLFLIERSAQVQFYLVMPKTLITLAQQNLKKYALFSKVEIEDASHTMANIGIVGPHAAQFLGRICQQPSIVLEIDDCIPINTEQGFCTLCRVPGRQPRYEIYGAYPQMMALWSELAKDCRPILPQGWELLDIQAGIPAVYPETIDLLLPHHVNLSTLRGISYNKGCYLGQEIIARMHYKGKIKKHLYHAQIHDLNLEHIPSPGTPIIASTSTGEAPAGLVVRASKSVQAGFDLLMMLDEQYADGKNLHLNTLSGPSVTMV